VLFFSTRSAAFPSLDLVRWVPVRKKNGSFGGVTPAEL